MLPDLDLDPHLVVLWGTVMAACVAIGCVVSTMQARRRRARALRREQRDAQYRYRGA